MCEALVTPGVTRWRRGQPGRVILYLKLMKLGRARFIPSLAGGMLATVPGICTIIFSACYMCLLLTDITFIRYLQIGLCAVKSILHTLQFTALFGMWQGRGVAALGLGARGGIAYWQHTLSAKLASNYYSPRCCCNSFLHCSKVKHVMNRGAYQCKLSLLYHRVRVRRGNSVKVCYLVSGGQASRCVARIVIYCSNLRPAIPHNYP